MGHPSVAFGANNRAQRALRSMVRIKQTYHRMLRYYGDWGTILHPTISIHNIYEHLLLKICSGQRPPNLLLPLCLFDGFDKLEFVIEEIRYFYIVINIQIFSSWFLQ